MRVRGQFARWLITASIGALALGALVPSAGGSGILPGEKRTAAPDFSRKDSQGKSIRLADLKGRTVLLNFWATWCHGCQTEIPWFVDFEKKYGDQGLAVVGISMDEDGWKSVRPYLEAKKLNYPVVIGDEELGKAYRLWGMPRTVLVDRDGRIAATYDGVVAKASFERDLQSLLHAEASGSR